MSTHLREDKECQNCGRTVDEVYCTRCGQKNTETRQSFGHLVAHFAEDLTHYDGAFWKTITHLLFRPAKLTKEYLKGKRQTYVPPVKLYIFISFISFLIPAFIPSPQRLPEYYAAEETRLAPDITKKEDLDVAGVGWEDKGGFFLDSPVSYRTLKEMDSIEAIKPDSLKLTRSQYERAAKIVRFYERNNSFEAGQIFTSKLPQLLSKGIFIYMPIFAFWLWLFHRKKRWYFFDHGIFTLHYFSLLMITSSIIVAFLKAYLSSQSTALGYVAIIVAIVLGLYQVFYFYKAHRKMYHESGIINFLKSSALFIINVIFMTILLFLLVYQSYNNLE